MDRMIRKQYYEIKHMDLTKPLEIFYIPFQILVHNAENAAYPSYRT
jgi:hypothetical protein